MYYGLILISVVLFGISFAVNRQYQTCVGSGMFSSFFLAAISSVAGVLILFPINGFRFECTVFTLIMACASALNGIAFTYCGLKTLGRVNLSLYSLFSMLGGMALPSVVGVLFYDEGMSLAKGLCYLSIVASLCLTVEKGESKGGYPYYAGVFLLNGMSGVITKFFQAAPYEKASAEGYSLLSALCTLVIAGILACLTYPSYRKKVGGKAIFSGVGYGAINRFANYLLVVALAHVPASVQYPMVTGGVMIVTTVIACFTADKPTKKQWLAVTLSFIGILLLVLIPY